MNINHHLHVLCHLGKSENTFAEAISSPERFWPNDLNSIVDILTLAIRRKNLE